MLGFVKDWLRPVLLAGGIIAAGVAANALSDNHPGPSSYGQFIFEPAGQTIKVPEFAVYIVQPGDTLSEIAERLSSGLYPVYDVTYRIAEYNGIENPDLIFPGQKIRLHRTWVKDIYMTR